MSIQVPADAPQWMHGVLHNIDRGYVPRVGNEPIRLPPYKSTDLPDAAKYIGRVIWVSDIKKPAVSDGIHWYPYTLGAAL